VRLTKKSIDLMTGRHGWIKPNASAKHLWAEILKMNLGKTRVC